MENIKPLDAEGLAVLWTQILLQFVKREEGKGLSTNDLTDELLQKIQSAGTSNFDGYYNSLIGQPQINGITLSGNKTLEDLGITQAITEAIGNVTQISFEVIPSFTDLPIIGEVGTFYLTPNNGSGNNKYDEWIWNENNSMYELIGSIQSDIDFDDYYTKEEVNELISVLQNKTEQKYLINTDRLKVIVKDRVCYAYFDSYQASGRFDLGLKDEYRPDFTITQTIIVREEKYCPGYMSIYGKNSNMEKMFSLGYFLDNQLIYAPSKTVSIIGTASWLY